MIVAGIATSSASDRDVHVGRDPELVGEQPPHHAPDREPDRDPDEQRERRDRRRLPRGDGRHLPAHEAERLEHGEVAAAAAHGADEDVRQQPEGEDRQRGRRGRARSPGSA